MNSMFQNLDNFKTVQEVVNHLQALFIKNKGDVQVQEVTNIQNFLTSFVDTEVALSCNFDLSNEVSCKFISQMLDEMIYGTDFENSIDSELVPMVNKYEYFGGVNVRILVRKFNDSIFELEDHIEFDCDLYAKIKNGEDEKLIILVLQHLQEDTAGYEMYLEVSEISKDNKDE